MRGSVTSRFWAKSLITRWCSTSQATSSIRSRSRPMPLAGRARRPGAGLLLAADAPPLPVSCSSMARNRASWSSISGMIGDRQRVVLGQAAGGDVGDHAHGPQGVLVDRVGVVHVELHLGDDAPELGDVAAEHARPRSSGSGCGRCRARAPARRGRPAPPPDRAAPWSVIRCSERVTGGEGVRVQVEVARGRRSRTGAAG